MTRRSALALVLAVLAFAGAPPLAAKPVPVSAPAITNVTVARSISVFAGVLTGFSDTSADFETLHKFLTITDNNGNSFVDTTTTVSAQPNALAVTGAGSATLGVSSSTPTPPASRCDVTVDFTTTVPTDFHLKGSVTSSNLSESGPQVAGCRLTGPGVSVGFGRTTASGPWVLTGDFSGILQPGTYRFVVVLKTSTVTPPDSQATGFSGLDFLVSAFQGTKLGTYAGLGTAAAGTTPSHATEGAAAVIVKPKSKFLAKFSQGGSLSTVTGTIDAAGRFLGKDGKSPIELKRSGRPDAALTLVGNGGLDKITGTLVESGTNATTLFDLDLAVYTSKKNPPLPLRNPATDLVGNYTIAFPVTAPAGQTLTPSIGTAAYPQGAGWATLTIDKNGFAKLKGKLADGSAISCAAPLAKDDTWPFYVPLYGGKGSISGRVSFRRLMGTDVDATALRWFNPGASAASIYPAGWPAGIVTDLVGARFITPTMGGPIPGIPTTDGAATVRISGGGLDASLITAPVTIASTGKVTIVGDNTALALTVSLSPKTGLMTGSFIHDATNKKVTFSGVIVQKLSSAHGFFLNAPQAGNVSIQ